MAVIKNISPDTRSLFRPDAPPVYPGDEVPLPDEVFVKYGWPSDTWEVVTPPALDGYVEDSPDDASIWVLADQADPDPAPAVTVTAKTATTTKASARAAKSTED